MCIFPLFEIQYDELMSGWYIFLVKLEDCLLGKAISWNSV